MNTSPGTVGSDPVILATAGYDHTVRFWQAHSGICTRTVQHQDSQVNALEVTPDRSMIAAAGYQHIRMYDLSSNNPNPIISYDGVNRNIASVGFHEDGRWMYTGGEDCTARIWDLRSRNLQCQRIFQVNAPINCVCLHPNQAELIVGDQSGAIHIWDLKTDHNEQLIPEPEVSITSAHIDPDASYMAAVNSTAPCHLLCRPDVQDLEDIQLLPDDGAQHQEQQPGRVLPRLDVGLRLLGRLAVHRDSLLGQPGPALVRGDRRDQAGVRGPPESCGLLGLQRQRAGLTPGSSRGVRLFPCTAQSDPPPAPARAP
uniref:Target of rapamycin complex subunit LST8 n=1 Tax=Suricata suricatta TaxID=37032 RepID=A0A673U1X4_SURSU